MYCIGGNQALFSCWLTNIYQIMIIFNIIIFGCSIMEEIKNRKLYSKGQSVETNKSVQVLALPPPCAPLALLGSTSPAALAAEMELVQLHVVLSCHTSVGGLWRMAVRMCI